MMNILDHFTCEIRIKDKDKVIAQASATNNYLHDLDVDEEYRRMGLAKTMISFLEREVNAKWLWVKSDNEPAVALYNNLGYKIIEIVDGYYKMQNDK